MAHYEIGDRLPVEPGDAPASKALPPKSLVIEPSPVSFFSKTASVVLLLLSYLLFVAPEFALPLALAAIFFGYRVSVRRGLTTVALNPFVVVPAISFLCGVFFYICGTARIQGYGYPGPHFGNLDRELRCYRSTSGCTVSGFEPFTQSPYNLALRILIKTFGPMRGAYTGPYPTSEEAFELIRQSSRRVTYEGLNTEVRRQGLSDTVPIEMPIGRGTPLSNKHPGYAVALYKESALIVGSEYGVCLIAKDSGQRFATMDFENLQAFRDWHEGSWSK